MSIRDALDIIILLFMCAAFLINDTRADELSAVERVLLSREIAEQIDRRQHSHKWGLSESTPLQDEWRILRQVCGDPMKSACIHKYYNERYSGYGELVK